MHMPAMKYMYIVVQREDPIISTTMITALSVPGRCLLARWAGQKVPIITFSTGLNFFQTTLE